MLPTARMPLVSAAEEAPRPLFVEPAPPSPGYNSRSRQFVFNQGTTNRGTTVTEDRSCHLPVRSAPKVVSEEIPPVPLTIEGYSVLHQMMRVRWAAWRQLPDADKAAIVDEAAGVLAAMEQNAGGQSALFSLLGHKGDLMFVHFRRSFDELNQAELQLAQLRLSDLSGADDVVPVGDRTGAVRIHDQGLSGFERARNRSAFG